MSKDQSRYTIYPRELKAGTFYYVRWRLPDGKRTSGQPTGKTTREAAERWAQERLEQGRRPLTDEIPTLAVWATGFFSEDSAYVRRRRARGYSFSKGHLSGQESIVKNYVAKAPFWHTRLDRITSESLDDFLLDLFEHGRPLEDGSRAKIAPRTVNSVRTALKTLFGEARRLNKIPVNPMDAVDKFKEIPVERGVLRMDEVRKLFEPDSVYKYWRGSHMIWLLSYVAAGTGLRQGELRALMPKYVRFRSRLILVEQALDESDALKAPKWNKTREVPMPQKVAEELEAWIEENHVAPGQFIFWSRTRKKEKDRPVSDFACRNGLKNALTAIGVSEEEQKARNLVFHSLRHGFAQAARDRVGDAMAKRAVGHSNTKTLDGYTSHKTGGEGYEKLTAFQDELFT